MQRTSSSSSVPTASFGRMAISPIVRCFRILRLPLPTTIPASPSAMFSTLTVHVVAAFKRLDLSVDPRKTLDKVSKHKWTSGDALLYSVLVFLALFSLFVMDSTLLRIGIPVAWGLAVLLPITSQFFWPGSYILAWVLVFFTSRFIPQSWRPSIHVVLLPALESILYGANISDLLTRYTHPVLDIIAWLPYGLIHFAIPGVVAAILWVFGPRGAVQFWAKAFGLMMLYGVLIQLVVPCSAPWYEIIHGLTPANYGMPGSPGGLMRIDRIFGGSGYTNTFGAAPLIFGAFPSLHSGNATMEALTLSHFFPRYKVLYWGYALVLYWSTMYLTHHYLIDVVGGGCLAMGCFYYFMPKEFRQLSTGIDWEDPALQAAQYEVVADEADEYDLDEEIRKLEGPTADEPYAANHVQTSDGTTTTGNDRKPKRKVSWGATQVLGPAAGHSDEGRSRSSVESS